MRVEAMLDLVVTMRMPWATLGHHDYYRGNLGFGLHVLNPSLYNDFEILILFMSS